MDIVLKNILRFDSWEIEDFEIEDFEIEDLDLREDFEDLEDK
jgi:hypothetical protein